MKNIFVKKIWTDNPIGYKYISLGKALDEYHYYINTCIRPYWDVKYYKPNEKLSIKTFKEWLKTEI